MVASEIESVAKSDFSWTFAPTTVVAAVRSSLNFRASFFQLVTNGILTGFGIVEYDGNAIIGSSTPEAQPPTFIGDGRLVFAPIEDLFFGFSLVVLTLIFWVWLGRLGVQRTPYSGPPRKVVSKLLRIDS